MGADYEKALDALEEAMATVSTTTKLMPTGCPSVICTELPIHWRSNKSLPTPFTVFALGPVPDGTIVSIAAGNEENSCADLRNNKTHMNSQIARFSDLRFVGKSGRGKNFHLTITIETKPAQIAILEKVIKVTVDGPRDSRTNKRTALERRSSCSLQEEGEAPLKCRRRSSPDRIPRPMPTLAPTLPVFSPLLNSYHFMTSPPIANRLSIQFPPGLGPQLSMSSLVIPSSVSSASLPVPLLPRTRSQTNDDEPIGARTRRKTIKIWKPYVH